ncbi:hypothetical protein MMC28_002281 [Mycoblastus sanguinarius]|nr:hypothetical protein [Mycoblastus sanguinarius]
MASIITSEGSVDDEALLSKESVDSYEKQPIVMRVAKRHTLLYSASCMLTGVVLSLVFLSVTSSVKLASIQRIASHCPQVHNNHVHDSNFYPVHLDLGLDDALPRGEEPVENGYWCGTTPEEAVEKGCKFDLILYSWVPPPCYDHELQISYREERESEWYRNRGGEGGEMVPQERAALGIEEGLWLSWAYHDYHCQFVFRMMTRILQNTSMGIPGRLLEDYHTHHCIKVLKGIEEAPKVDISTLVSLNYSTCYSRV